MKKIIVTILIFSILFLLVWCWSNSSNDKPCDNLEWEKVMEKFHTWLYEAWEITSSDIKEAKFNYLDGCKIKADWRPFALIDLTLNKWETTTYWIQCDEKIWSCFIKELEAAIDSHLKQ